MTSSEVVPMPVPEKICAGALVLALPLALGSLVAFGTWSKAEILPIWLHVAAALGALGLIFGLLRGSGAIGAALTHPLVLATAAPGLWSAIAAPFVALPMLSLAGPIQSGYGAVWFLDSAVLVACGLVVREHPRVWQALLWLAMAVGLVITGLIVRDYLVKTDLLLLYVVSYYGWAGLALAAAMLCGSVPRRQRLAGLAIALFLVIAARGATAMAVLLLGGLYLAAAHVWRHRPAVAKLTSSRVVAVGAVMVMACLPYLILRSLPDSAIESLRDRQLLWRMVHAALGEQGGAAWLIGNGWGRIQDVFHAYMTLTGENLWRGTWIFLQSDYFHPHNWALDAVYAVGLPGLILVLAALVAIPFYAGRDRLAVATAFAVALAGVGSLWFQIAVSAPYVALALAGLARPLGQVRAPRGLMLPVLVAILAAQLTFAGLQIRFITAVAAFMHGAVAEFPVDPRGSDLTASSIIRDEFTRMAERKGVLLGDTNRALAMVRTLEARSVISESGHFLGTAVYAMGRIYGTGELLGLAERLPEGQALWTRLVNRLLVVAPWRSDLVIPYLAHQAVVGNMREVRRVTDILMAHSAMDPVGLYFTGLLLVLEPSPQAKAKGIEALRASVDAGIERFMPLDDAVKALIGRN